MASQAPPHEAIRDRTIELQLQARRQRLQSAIESGSRADSLIGLLRDVDAALERMHTGVFGICETCHDPIENDRLLLDPLCRNCLDHLTTAEQRALERDLDLAAQVQKGLLPISGPVGTGWTMTYHYEPAGSLSGDYCDLIAAGDDALFALGDVTGKGVAASMLMAQLHAIFRSLTTTAHYLPDLIAKANRIFCEGTVLSYFATLVCGWLAADGAVEICNAGHCRPLHVLDGQAVAIESTGLPLGLFCEGEYNSQTIRLQRGQSLVLYTDGLTEAFNTDGSAYGTARLAELVRRHGDLPPGQLMSTVIDDVHAYRTGTSRRDDLTVMILHREA